MGRTNEVFDEKMLRWLYEPKWKWKEGRQYHIKRVFMISDLHLIYLTHWGCGHLNCLNARSQGLNNLNQLLYCVYLKIYNKFVN